jgi:hypothetical protein
MRAGRNVTMPRPWVVRLPYVAERARSATRIAITVWLVLLAILVAMIILWGARQA